MEKLLKNRRDAFDMICSIIKALALFFCFYPLFGVFFKSTVIESLSEMSMDSVLISLLMLVSVLTIWLVLQQNRSTQKWRRWLEIGVFYIVCCASVAASGGSNSNYKFLFMFMVVTYTIQYGMKYGMSIAIVTSVTLLGMDVFTSETVSVFFQSDFALSIMFIITAYILGRYVNLEAKHIEELTQLATIDSLTGLSNHRYFHERLEQEWKSAREKGTNVAMLMMDIDYFKMYNDICGHVGGDNVLARIAVLIRENAREGDACCRYGGEEFTVILPDMSAAEANEIAERIRIAVMEDHMEGEEYLPNGCLTISIGVSEMQKGDVSYSEMLSRADNALYRAKYLRKNRVETYENVFDRFDDLDEKTKDALLSVQGLVGIINVRDDFTYSHTERVVMCCDLVAREMGRSKTDSRVLIISAYMHDVGKINIPREVLISNERLTPEEWQMIRKHPIGGKTILSQISGMEKIGEIVAQHHENYDGTGYPYGLKGDEINPLASILSLADSFDAMTNDRPYQKRKSYEDALQEIRRCSGHQFNPKYTELFISAIEKALSDNGFAGNGKLNEWLNNK